VNDEVITDVNIITNLLKLIQKTATQVHIRVLLNEYSGTIKSIEYDEIKFYTKFKVPTVDTSVRVNFYYLNKYFYFETTILSKEKDTLSLKMPKTIYRHYKRRTTRYDIDNLNIFADLKLIHIADSPSLDLIKSNLQYSHIKNEIVKEAREDVPDANKILQLILKEIKEYFITDNISVVLPVKKEDIVVKILKIWRKPFLIQYTQEYDKYFENPFSDDVVTFKEYIKILKKNTTDDKKIDNFIHRMINEYEKMDIFSILYTPIYVSNILVGYFIASNRLKSTKAINKNEIQYFKEATEILHEAFLKRRLNSMDTQELRVKVKDISTSGVGLDVFDSLLASVLQKETKVRCDINIKKNRGFFFTGIVKNRRKNGSRLYIGIEIREIINKNRIILYNFIDEIKQSNNAV